MDSTAPPMMDGQGAPQQHAYDARSNGLTRQPTDPLDQHNPPRSQSLTPSDRADAPVRSMTDPAQNEQQMQAPKPKRSGKICGKCGEGLTGQFVRALGGTYHLECFTCHVGILDFRRYVLWDWPAPNRALLQLNTCQTNPELADI